MKLWIGSPPPMRGKVFPVPPQVFKSRITPAYAGKRTVIFDMRYLLKDHPRLCGEKLHRFGNFRICQGSSPPMRGKASGLQSDKLISRITPAYAGKSQRRLVVVCFGQDHPRLCGEKPEQPTHCGTVLGSPPPMRGKVAFT